MCCLAQFLVVKANAEASHASRAHALHHCDHGRRINSSGEKGAKWHVGNQLATYRALKVSVKGSQSGVGVPRISGRLGLAAFGDFAQVPIAHNLWRFA